MVKILGTKIDKYNEIKLDDLEKELLEPDNKEGVKGEEFSQIIMEIEDGKVVSYKPYDRMVFGTCATMEGVPNTHALQSTSDIVNELHQEQEFIAFRERLGMPRSVSYQDTDTLYTRMAEFERGLEEDHYEHDDSKETEAHKERTCWVCGKQLHYTEYVDRNVDSYYTGNYSLTTKEKKDNKTKELEKQWESDKVQIACCSCYDTLEALQKRKLRTIQIVTESRKIYDVKGKTFHKEIMNWHRIHLIFSDLNKEIKPNELKGLVSKGFIEVSEEVVRALLGGNE